MKKYLRGRNVFLSQLALFAASFLLPATGSAQAGMWTWVKGDNFLHPPAVFGTMGIPSINNKPPGLYGAASFVDLDGNLWLFAGNDGLGNSATSLPHAALIVLSLVFCFL